MGNFNDGLDGLWVTKCDPLSDLLHAKIILCQKNMALV